MAAFDLGCALSRLGEIEPALASLRQAIKRVGEETFEERLRTDPDLEAVRSLPTFQRFILGITDVPVAAPPLDPIQRGSSLVSISAGSVALLEESRTAQRAGDSDRAAERLERCVKPQPRAHLCYLRLGEVYETIFRQRHDAGALARSRDAYQRFLQITPADDPSVPEVWAILRKAP